ncbi:DUF2802 domain-containing protein [Stutzerimonas tarimensis]|uniref:DUF2802 domain-containing protein n=1 Tax=Stutzerimonas tarimensis TaxID=1507735 RepID=A0ABV7TAD2_9GAMM
MLLALVACSLVLCVLLTGACLLLHRQQRQLAQQLEQREAALQKAVEALGRRLETYQAGNIAMGEELRGLAELAQPLAERLNQLEQRDPGSLSFSQAARLVGLGATVDDLTRTCGLSQAEAELMSRLHQVRRSDP